jgi:hypothetical protein
MEPHSIRDQHTQRAEVKDQLKRGSTSLSQVLQEAQADDVISGMQVSALLESLPGIGKARGRQIMNRLGIAESALVRELSAEQRRALEGEQGRPTGLVGSGPGRSDQDETHDEDEDEDYDEDIAPDEIPHNGEGYGIEEWDRP